VGSTWQGLKGEATMVARRPMPEMTLTNVEALMEVGSRTEVEVRGIW
jgi:hypothetical protein